MTIFFGKACSMVIVGSMVIGVDWAVLRPQHWRKAFWSATQFL